MNDIPFCIITSSQLFKVVSYVLHNFNEMKNKQFENEEGRLSSENCKVDAFQIKAFKPSIKISQCSKFRN